MELTLPLNVSHQAIRLQVHSRTSLSGLSLRSRRQQMYFYDRLGPKGAQRSQHQPLGREMEIVRKGPKDGATSLLLSGLREDGAMGSAG